jgi:uncharacterized membrane protein (UPF0182 family)
VGLWLFWDLLSHLIAEIFWFQDVGYVGAFLKRLRTQIGVWSFIGILSAGFSLGNLFLANRLKYSLNQPELRVRRQNWADSNSGIAKTTGRVGYGGTQQLNAIGVEVAPRLNTLQRGAAIRLRLLLPITLLLSIVVGVMLLHYSQIAISLWRPDWSLPNVTPPLPPAFDWDAIGQLFPLQIWQWIVLPVVAIALLINPQFWLTGIASVLTLFFAFVVSGHWDRILEYFAPTAFNAVDPLFKHDISFYIFSFPVWQLLYFWLGGLSLFTLVAVTLVYLLSGDSISQGKFPGFSPEQLRHLYGLGITVAASTALGFWLSRYELLYSQRGVTYGAGYTDVNVQLPVNTALSLVAVGIALWLLVETVIGFGHQRSMGKKALIVLGVYLTAVAIAAEIVPNAVQRLSVQPNELVRERPYIQRNIALTRSAFALDRINVEIFNPEGQLTRTDLAENERTIRNIRLWDTRPLLQTNRQLQQIRLYYRFPDAQIDRYTLKVDTEAIPPIVPFSEQEQVETPTTTETDKQQVIIAARELDYSEVPEQAQTWVNKHLVYTHGYGFTLSPVNAAGPGGLPEYYVKNIGVGVADGFGGSLETSSEAIRDSIPIGAPRIYYGLITDTYVMTASRIKEFDYPRAEENAYNTYDGNGGVPLGSWWQRLVFAQYLKDWQMLFTRNFTPQTRLLFRRNINERVRAIAPFLRYDSQPYLVVADASEVNEPGAENYLYWIIDAYTASDEYPYSDPGQHEFNYMRNSVKVVIDAYHGDVDFYVADPTDPIIHTWNAIFPELFKPLSTMPVTLLSHIRYPPDFFGVQSEQLLTYHMTDPQVFYNREDLWRIPQEIYAAKPQPIEPYYLIMRLPSATSEEFILLNPYTPNSRNNLIAWLAARSDGENYGTLLLYQFPKQELVYGPEQIEALINQDPVISQQISLWNRQGSRAIQGNLLVIPIERSLLYVEPLYLEAEQNSLPTLARVIVVYENRIVMAETLSEALQGIFNPAPQDAPTIIRPVPTDGEQPLPLAN